MQHLNRILLLIAVMINSPWALRAQTYESLVADGLSAAERDSLEQAEAFFKQALKTAPTDYRNSLVFTNLGRVQEAQYRQQPSNTRKADEAIESYTYAINMAPESIPMLLARANLYYILHRYDKALLDYTRILDLDGLNAEARQQRANIYAQRHQYAAAKTDYEQVLEHDPENYMCALGMAILCQNTQRLSEAIERMTKLVEVHSEQAELYSVRADMYVERGQFELALLDLDEAIRLDACNENYVLARAYLHRQMGNRRLALRDFEQAIQLGVPRSALREDMKF